MVFTKQQRCQQDLGSWARTHERPVTPGDICRDQGRVGEEPRIWQRRQGFDDRSGPQAWRTL